ncbi:GIY-YIG nuclease family protein [Candidatus Pelagibacter sp.]|nr:GIY-YIG nuclease family protein [Candidatus Pelagibacter sp.]MDC3005115.1 GIY-YIG nuclease family protein [Candidatus Pelagibacter sp.]|tara:strand:- start:377 stop:1384 length:1008 start_codon:yes stop_codon:yes gene_type:complete
MIFYITESIGGTRWDNGKKHKASHVKVGIANDVEQRFKEYNIVLPYISPVRKYPVSKSFGRNLEKMFKYYLREFRLWKSECYHVSPKEAIFFLSRCYISSGQVMINYLSKRPEKGDLFYLDSIYFGKKIPLFIIKKVRKFKKDSIDRDFSIELIKDWGRKKTKAFYGERYDFHYEEVIEDKYNFSKNILYHFIKRREDVIQNQINLWNKYNDENKDQISIEDMIEFFSQQMFWVLRDYNLIFKNNKKKKKVFIRDFEFFEKKLKSYQSLVPGESLGICVRRIRARYFYSLSWMLDTKGSPSKLKSDPYMFTADLRYWTRFSATPKIYKSLLSNKY